MADCRASIKQGHALQGRRKTSPFLPKNQNMAIGLPDSEPLRRAAFARHNLPLLIPTAP
jgi:hypothetical protein